MELQVRVLEVPKRSEPCRGRQASLGNCPAQGAGFSEGNDAWLDVIPDLQCSALSCGAEHPPGSHMCAPFSVSLLGARHIPESAWRAHRGHRPTHTPR